MRKKIKRCSKDIIANNRLTAACMALIVCLFYLLCAVLEETAIFISGSNVYWSALNVPNPDVYRLIISLKTPLIITVSSFIAYLFLLSPLKLGQKKWYITAAGFKYEDLCSVFVFFKSIKTIFKSAFYGLFSTLLTLFWGILFFLPSFFLFCLSMKFLYTNNSDFVSYFSAASFPAVLLFSAVSFSVFIKRYFAAGYILASDTAVSVFCAFRISVDISHGFKTELFLFETSFLWLKALNLLIFPAVYSVPYIFTARAVFAKSLLNSAAPRSVKLPQCKTSIFNPVCKRTV